MFGVCLFLGVSLVYFGVERDCFVLFRCLALGGFEFGFVVVGVCEFGFCCDFDCFCLDGLGFGLVFLVWLFVHSNFVGWWVFGLNFEFTDF